MSTFSQSNAKSSTETSSAAQVIKINRFNTPDINTKPTLSANSRRKDSKNENGLISIAGDSMSGGGNLTMLSGHSRSLSNPINKALDNPVLPTKPLSSFSNTSN